ncbi:hypothetical protein NMG60_11035306 [Bertholletia excelsa]
MDMVSKEKSKVRKCEEECNQPRSWIGNLPHDVALDIISRLAIASLMQSRFVGRAWNELSHDPNLVELHFRWAARNNPCLILHCDYPIRNELYFVELSDNQGNEVARKFQLHFQQVMPEFNVIASCNGMLCLSKSLCSDPLCIHNPFTGEFKELPRSRQFDKQEVALAFGFHPLTKEYKLDRIVHSCTCWGGVRGLKESVVQVLRPGDANWRGIGEAPFLVEQQPPEVLVNGRLHWLALPDKQRGTQNGSHCSPKSIVSFDIADEKFREIPRPDCEVLNNFNLAVLGGCLSAVVWCHFENFEIWIMKYYGVKESWVKEYYVDYCWQLVQVLCLLKNGNLLIECKGGVLVSYDPVSGNYENLMFQGMP